MIQTALLLSLSMIAPAPAADPIPVYVLAGQSNMEGKARVEVMERQLLEEATAARYAHLRDGDEWLVRDDVVIDFLDRRGPLTVGYGSPERIGPELGFGQVVGDHHDEPVLIIKTAWGGRSLWRDFRSPGAGLPADEVIDELLERQRKRRPETTREEVAASFGATYRSMLEEIRATLDDSKALFPGGRRKLELRGFVWFQGWNDMIDARATAEYAENMAHFIRDVREDLEAPELPFVIGQFGVGGEAASHPKHLRFKEAQIAPASLPEFEGNVAVVRTDAHWDTEAQEVFDRGWKENLEEWNKVGSDRPYHYLGSPRTMLGIGEAFGEAVLELTRAAPKRKTKKRRR